VQIRGEQEADAVVMHIAEKFKRAWDARLARLAQIKAKQERNWGQQKRREIRRSAAKMAIEEWEWEV
jgi:hypothetical protein